MCEHAWYVCVIVNDRKGRRQLCLVSSLFHFSLDSRDETWGAGHIQEATLPTGASCQPLDCFFLTAELKEFSCIFNISPFSVVVCKNRFHL